MADESAQSPKGSASPKQEAPLEASVYDALSAEELYERGKHYFKVLRDFGEAAECFSRCLELRSGDNPNDTSLRECYLWYADSLLTKEEESQAVLATEVETGNDSDLPTADSILENAGEREACDESLAFEAFQVAFACYSGFLSECTLEGAELEKEVLDASYCLVRLGDMFLANNQFDEAAAEYGRAVELRRKYRLPDRHFASLYVSLAQSLMFSGRLGASLQTFVTAKELIFRLLVGEMDEDKRKRMHETLEDVELQIDDLRKMIASSSATTTQQGSQCNAASLVPQTTGAFDERMLESDSKSAVINVSENSTGAKRRIDISGMYK
ncbi:homeodomain-like containing protein [Babesia caballi]|uniref:Homeodomain-like containing protein n=1 Tax=Babesia caballi TaxID=5871 RepID=A0AAV4LYZ5_BABCB|nr:homeodomain-like containing protein [Babesia caballi]